jgi:hypothetical protein
MKKIIISAAIAAALIAGTTAPSFAAAKKIGTAKTSAGAEGTATHEMSESSGTQKSEGSSTAKKAVMKKVVVKKSAKK